MKRVRFRRRGRAEPGACAGGASVGSGLLLLVLLAPFFVYRTWKVRHAITSQKGWSRSKLKRQGLTEALYGLGWVALVVLTFHLDALLDRL